MPVIVLIAGVLVSVLSALATRQQNQARDQLRLQLVTERIQADASERLGKYVSLARSAVGFFEASNLDVSADQFRRFWAAAKLESNFPGILALGYIEKVPAAEKNAFEAKHRQRIPSFHIYPAGPRDPYFAATFAEPGEGPRLASLGFDPFTEPNRRKALEAARDSGTPQMSSPVILKIEEKKGKASPAFLLFAPIYATPEVPSTVEARRASLRGFIGASFRVEELLEGIRSPSAHSQVAFRIYSGNRTDTEALLMASRDFPKEPQGLRHVTMTSIEGFPWTFEYVTLPAFEAESDRALEVGGFGVILSLLVYGFTLSLTQARQADERALHHERARAQDLQDLDQAKTRFFSNLSHELRTPLNGILGMTDLLWDTPLNGVQKDYLATIGTCGKTLLDLISDVLDVSKIEAGKLELQEHSFPLRQPFEAALEVVRGQAQGKDLKLELFWDDKLPTNVKGDLIRLRQILVNLLSNAVKFTDHGSVSVRTQATNDGIEIEIQDTGIGISLENQKKLFYPFSQISTEGTELYQGTGLGLSITKELVELMKGSISLTSQPRVGTVFKISLPLVASEADTQESPTRTALPPRAGGGFKLLVADDNPVNRRVLILQLEKLGYSADSVEDGKQAVEAVQNTKYDLVLMDCQMPHLDGLQATRMIRETTQQGPVIVALTAHAQPQQRVDCEAAGMDDFLTKPVEMTRLGATLEKWRSHLETTAQEESSS